MTSIFQSAAALTAPCVRSARMVIAIRMAFLPVFTAGIASGAAAATAASAEASIQYDIPAGPLDDALSLFAQQSGIALAFDATAIRGLSTQGLHGLYSIEEGFTILLQGSGHDAVRSRTGYRLVQQPKLAQAAPAADPPAVTDAERRASADTAVLATLTVTGKDDGFKAQSQSTATKTPLSIRETPQSISVVTRDQLEARQVLDIGTALQTSAGVSQASGPGAFAGIGHYGYGETQIRGINNDTGISISSDRVDGFRNPIFSVQQDMAPYERVEVIKGPSSVLYGRSSAGGFVNRVRKTPQRQSQSTVAATIGSWDLYRLEGDITGPMDDSNRIAGRLIAAYQSAGSFVDDVKGDRIVFAPSMEVNIGPDTRLLVLGDYQRDEFLPNPGFPLAIDFDDDGNPVGKYRAPRVSRSHFFGVQDEEKKTTKAISGSARLEQNLGDSWLASLTLNRGASDEVGGSGLYPYSFYAGGDTNIYSSRFLIDRDFLSGELRINGSFDFLGRKATAVMGVDREELTLGQDYAFSVLEYAYPGYNISGIIPNIYLNNFSFLDQGGPGPISLIQELKQVGTGVFAQFQFRPLDRLSVLLGARYDRAETSRRVVLSQFGTLPVDDKADKLTGRAALSYEIRHNITAYGMFSQSFDPVMQADIDGEILDPETGEIFEAGIKTDWFNGSLGVNAAVFRLDRNKMPMSVGRTTDGRTIFESSGKQRSNGFELEINGEPVPGWRVSFGGILLDADFLRNEAFDTHVGRTPSGSADWQAGLFTSYEMQSGPLRGLGAGLGVYAIGDRGVQNRDAKLSGYERVDLSLFYTGIPNTRISLLVRNVTDETYVEGAPSANGGAQFGSPVAAMLTVRYRAGS